MANTNTTQTQAPSPKATKLLTNYLRQQKRGIASFNHSDNLELINDLETGVLGLDNLTVYNYVLSLEQIEQNIQKGGVVEVTLPLTLKLTDKTRKAYSVKYRLLPNMNNIILDGHYNELRYLAAGQDHYSGSKYRKAVSREYE